jgi:hypothetical protein
MPLVVVVAVVGMKFGVEVVMGAAVVVVVAAAAVVVAVGMVEAVVVAVGIVVVSATHRPFVHRPSRPHGVSSGSMLLIEQRPLKQVPVLQPSSITQAVPSSPKPVHVSRGASGPHVPAKHCPTLPSVVVQLVPSSAAFPVATQLPAKHVPV